MEGITESGFAWEIPEESVDNYELLEVLHKIDTGNYGLLPEMVDKLLGTEQRDRLKEHLRDQNGRVTTTGMVSEVMQIFKSAGKNS